MTVAKQITAAQEAPEFESTKKTAHSDVIMSSLVDGEFKGAVSRYHLHSSLLKDTDLEHLTEGLLVVVVCRCRCCYCCDIFTIRFTKKQRKKRKL